MVSREDIAQLHRDPQASVSLHQRVVDDASPLSVILPAHNEAGTIKDTLTEFFDEINAWIPIEFIVAEDGSVDGTREILISLRDQLPMVLLSDHSRKGYARGVRDALKSSKSGLVFFSDSDGQYFPSDFWSLWNERDGYDMIIGVKLQRNESLYRRALALGFHKIANTLFGLSFRDMDCGFRLIRSGLIKEIIDDVGRLEYSFWAEFTIRAKLRGFKICEVPIHHSGRVSGDSHIYKPKNIPFIVIKQLRGLLRLYSDMRKNSPYSEARKQLWPRP